MKTKAAVLYQPGDLLRTEILDLDAPKDGEVLVRYVASGICHSDLNHIQGTAPWPTPVVLGHEGAGVVLALGPGVTRVRVGDHVLTSYVPFCGSCSWCAIGRPNLCDLRYGARHKMLDGSTRFSRDGLPIFHYLYVSTFSEFAVVPETSLIPIRKDAPLDVVCLMGCSVTTGVGAVVHRANVEVGASVVIYGCGGIGLNSIQAAAMVGAHRIIAVDIVGSKLSWAMEFGATHAIDATKSDPVDEVLKLCGRGGADYAIEAVGSEQTILQALASVHRGGTVVLVGVCPEGTRILVDPKALLHERILTGSSFGSVRQPIDIPKLIDLYMDGKLRVKELINHRTDVEGLNNAFELLQRGALKRGVLVY